MVFCYQIAPWVSGECEIVGRTLSLSVQHCSCMQLIISSRSVQGNGGRVERLETQYICKFFRRYLLRHPVLTPKTVGAALVEVFAVILPVEATAPLVNAPVLLISEASMVCVTLDVTAATTTTAAVMAPSIHPVGVHLVVGLPSPNRGGEFGRSGTLPAVVIGTDSHWRDPWPNIAQRLVPHA